HVHIVIGSLRIRAIECQPHMEKPCDWKEGCKNRCTAAMLRHLRAGVMELCQSAGLYQIDLLKGSGDRITEREYWAQRRGQRRLDYANAKDAASGLDRKSTRLNSSHVSISYAVFCLKKKKCTQLYIYTYFFCSRLDAIAPYSFPTRRSSDLSVPGSWNFARAPDYIKSTC